MINNAHEADLITCRGCNIVGKLFDILVADEISVCKSRHEIVSFILPFGQGLFEIEAFYISFLSIVHLTLHLM